MLQADTVRGLPGPKETLGARAAPAAQSAGRASGYRTDSAGCLQPAAGLTALPGSARDPAGNRPPTAPVMFRFTVLGLGCGHYFTVVVEPGRAELQGGLGLQVAPLIHQLVASQRDLLLQRTPAGFYRRKPGCRQTR